MSNNSNSIENETQNENKLNNNVGKRFKLFIRSLLKKEVLLYKLYK